jgi:hypothetical protein
MLMILHNNRSDLPRKIPTPCLQTKIDKSKHTNKSLIQRYSLSSLDLEKILVHHRNVELLSLPTNNLSHIYDIFHLMPAECILMS